MEKKRLRDDSIALHSFLRGCGEGNTDISRVSRDGICGNGSKLHQTEHQEGFFTQSTGTSFTLSWAVLKSHLENALSNLFTFWPALNW